MKRKPKTAKKLDSYKRIKELEKLLKEREAALAECLKVLWKEGILQKESCMIIGVDGCNVIMADPNTMQRKPDENGDIHWYRDGLKLQDGKLEQLQNQAWKERVAKWKDEANDK